MTEESDTKEQEIPTQSGRVGVQEIELVKLSRMMSRKPIGSENQKILALWTTHWRWFPSSPRRSDGAVSWSPTKPGSVCPKNSTSHVQVGHARLDCTRKQLTFRLRLME